MNIQKIKGLTLIEVLVALLIISIAMTAIIKVVSQSIKNHTYLENKIIASYVACNQINQVRAGLIQMTHLNEPLTGHSILFNTLWEWELIKKSTSNPRIQEIDVDVFNSLSKTPLSHLTGYLYEPENNA